jgi:hypothetical protein
MQSSVVHIVKELEGAQDLDARVSFRGFVDFLKERRMVEKTMRVKYLDYVISVFGQRLGGKVIIELEEIGQYGELLELMYSCIFPAVADERQFAWALGVPVTPIIFYGTDPFYDKLRDPVTHLSKACMVEKGELERKKMNWELVYSIILKRLYDFEFKSGNSVIRSLKDQSTGLVNFYRLNIDARFIEVFSRGELPHFDPHFLQSRPGPEESVAWLKENLPLEAFRFEGISAITVTDITTEYVLESIKGIILNPERHDKDAHQQEVIRYLNVLAGSNDVRFGLLPLLKVNGKTVYSDETCHHSVLADTADDREETEETYLCLVDNYFQEPRLILYERIPGPEPGEHYFLETLRRNGIRSYGLLPVYHNSRLAGVLELSARKPDCLSRDLLVRLEAVIPLIAQLLQHTIDEFESRIKAIVKENFTSLQPAVEWKFNEVAWQYDQSQQQGQEPVLEPIFFKGVYPLYGAIDIRNSTMERNGALRRDMEIQFRLLTEALVSLQQAVSLQLVDEIIHQTQKWQAALTGALTTADELNLNSFLRDKVGDFLLHFRESRPDLASLMDTYIAAMDEEMGEAYTHRRGLEESIQLINKTINEALEQTVPDLQASYPSYFEKFRTDGVEYDIYIGQSIAPDRPFDLLYLRNLRLWQLASMTKIARGTHELLPQMEVSLLTTQLIFVHSTAIDISFRKDERRFDVEGGYNIRYQVVKKRIDKVRIRDTGERLTQPGKIAIIYFNEREAEEYEGYIRYLQEKGKLELGIERLELEDLQGVSGLRALRVGVSWG